MVGYGGGNGGMRYNIWENVQNQAQNIFMTVEQLGFTILTILHK